MKLVLPSSASSVKNEHPSNTGSELVKRASSEVRVNNFKKDS